MSVKGKRKGLMHLGRSVSHVAQPQRTLRRIACNACFEAPAWRHPRRGMVNATCDEEGTSTQGMLRVRRHDLQAAAGGGGGGGPRRNA